MAFPRCYLKSVFDEKIAEKFAYVGNKSMTAERVTALRGLYDTKEAETAEKEGRDPEYLLPDNPTDEDIENAFYKLTQMKANIRSQLQERATQKTKRWDRLFNHLRHAFSSEDRRNRTKLLSVLFSEEVDRLCARTGVSRLAVVNGFRGADGGFYGGAASIMESVYNKLLEDAQDYYYQMQDDNVEACFQMAKKSGLLSFYGAPEDIASYKLMCEERFGETFKLLRNFEQFTPFVFKALTRTEGLRVGKNGDYASTVSSDNFGDNEIEAVYNVEEATKEGWMEKADMKSAFESIGLQVRRVLSTIPEVKRVPVKDPTTRKVTGFKYVPVVDSIGCKVFMDPTTAHQQLADFLRGIRTSDDLFERISYIDPNDRMHHAVVPWMEPIVKILETNPRVATQFFVDFKKNFQLYSEMWEDKEHSFGPIKNIKTRILNKVKNILIGKFKSAIAKGHFPEGTGFYNFSKDFYSDPLQVVYTGTNGGNINWENVIKLRSIVKDWVSENRDNGSEDDKNNNDGTQVGVFKNQKAYKISKLTDFSRNSETTLNQKADFLKFVFDSLGIEVSYDAIYSILRSKEIYKVRELLEKIFDCNTKSGKYSGFRYLLSGSAAKYFSDAITVSKSSEERNTAITDLDSLGMSMLNSYKANFRSSSDEKVNYFRDNLNSLLDIICNKQNAYRVESRCRYQGNTMFSNVAPSFLGDRLEAIQSFVNNNDKEGLKKYLQEKYLCSAYFRDEDGNILNYWLREMIAACDDGGTSLADSVAAIFSYERDLGSDTRKFEDFPTRDHAIDMFIHYFADEKQKKGYGGRGTRNLDKKTSAMFPVFTLGDAGVSKYIRGPRITTAIGYDADGKETTNPNEVVKVTYRFDHAAEERVLDEFYNIYLQELRRMEIDKAIAGTGLTYYANGKEVVPKEGAFSLLTFLNDPAYEIPAEDKYRKDVVKAHIRQYLEDASIGKNIKHRATDGSNREIAKPSFKERLQEVGALEEVDDYRNTKKGEKPKRAFKYFDSIAKPENEDEVNEKIKDFFWNTTLATTQQLQIMTIDPSFYDGTKTLQKRYKETHAPGSSLDIYARNPYSLEQELFCPERTIVNADGSSRHVPQGMETVVYFNDLNTNAEKLNPEYMEAIFRTYAVLDKDAIDAAVKDGICIPKQNPAEELNRIDRLKEALGDNFDIYNAYQENTLTDGQGYRTLKSMRMVMGMAGKWDPEMETAYNRIMSIRKKHEIKDDTGKVIDYSDLEDDERDELLKLSVIFQPIKPYLFTHEKRKINVNVKDADGNYIGTRETTQLIPVQNKYAEAVIIPELLPKGNKLRDLGLWMDNNEVDVVGSTKIAKVGAWGAAELKDVTDTNTLNDALNKAVIHEYDYSDYRIQTNVPMHISGDRLFGTQIRKLIMAGLNYSADSDYSSYLGGVNKINLDTGSGHDTECKASGKNILALYNSLHCANILDSFRTFLKNAGMIDKLADILQQSTVSSTREAMDNLFAYVVTGQEEHLKKFMVPLWEGGIEHDTAALIWSTFRKIVNKQQITGGSAVQVSAFGISGYREDGDLRFVTDPSNPSNILYAEIEMPFDRSIMVERRTADGSIVKDEVKLPFEKYCNPDGTLIPGTYIDKETNYEEWKEYQSYTYKEVNGKLVPCHHTDPEAKVYKPLIEEDYPKCLNIIAYRIPTERHYSMINCRIKRFTSRTAGGTMKVPPQGTTIAGFDFDIDKLYFMQREYHKHINKAVWVEDNFSDEDKLDIWNQVWEDYPDIKKALEKKREEAEAKDSTLYEDKEVPRVRGGIVVGSRTKRIHKTTLNSYWDKDIEDRFNKAKNDVFAETAQELGISPSEKLIKEGEEKEYLDTYNFEKSPEENKRHTRNNLLIDLIQARLQDPETMRQRYTPGGFQKSKKAALRMRILQFADYDRISTNRGGIRTIDWESVDKYVNEVNDKKSETQDPEPNYDPCDPYTMLIYNQQNQVAKKLIGIFANQNTHHAFTSCLHEFKLKESIDFCGHKYADFLHHGNPEEAARVDLNMAELLAASVDAVKDPVLNFLNLNIITADAGAMLIRLGYEPEEVGLLLNQPIIKRVCEEAQNRGVNINTAIKNAITDISGNVRPGTDTNHIELSRDVLANGIISEHQYADAGKNREAYIKDNAATQLAVLDLFSKILKASDDVSSFVQSTKFTASNSVKSTFGGMYAQQLNVAEFLSKFPNPNVKDDKGSLSYTIKITDDGTIPTPISDDQSLIIEDIKDPEQSKAATKEYLRRVRFNPFAFEQAMFDANRSALKALSRYYPYETDTYRQAREFLNELCMYGHLTEDEINDIHSNIPVAFLAKQRSTIFDGEATYTDERGNPTNMTNREYYRTRFAKDLNTALENDPKLRSSYIFGYLFPTVETTTIPHPSIPGETIEKEEWGLTIQDVGGLDSTVKDEIRESWAELMATDDNGEYINKEYAKIGRDLFMYCFYQLGFDFSPLSFMHLAPIAVKENIRVDKSWDENISSFTGIPVATIDDKPTDNVLVWSSSTYGAKELADEFGAEYGVEGDLVNNSYKLPDELTTDNIEELRRLCRTARSHPELKFHIYRELTPAELALFELDTLKMSVPGNIIFSQETLDAADDSIKDKISYGRSRSYIEFLNEIQDEKERSLDTDEFAQMFILNHLDDPRFVLDSDKVDKILGNILSAEFERGQNSDGTITIDISSYTSEEQESAISRLCSIERNGRNIGKGKWAPCIKYNDSYYMPVGNTAKFNETLGTLSITYRKVEPLGTSKTITYDGNKKLKPIMRYQSSMDPTIETNENYVWSDNSSNQEGTQERGGSEGNTNPEEYNGVIIGGRVRPDEIRENLEKEIVTQLFTAAYYNGLDIDINKLKSDLNNETEDQIRHRVEEIRAACRKGGVLMLNAEGKLQFGC